MRDELSIRAFLFTVLHVSPLSFALKDLPHKRTGSFGCIVFQQAYKPSHARVPMPALPIQAILGRSKPHWPGTRFQRHYLVQPLTF
jgi:hypothetical protein